ncbi:hypothetical protein AVEN_243154-1 [Araneus ventricosus]|uniref:Uncharacterized protein n=1 Tax=Araneus ventricosus TaxID=182803 RepID=A0A4Y2N4G9_ARAVE|nr:hypothetical protein AVEN_243154-1 [Araneus ventricosus]
MSMAPVTLAIPLDMVINVSVFMSLFKAKYDRVRINSYYDPGANYPSCATAHGSQNLVIKVFWFHLQESKRKKETGKEIGKKIYRINFCVSRKKAGRKETEKKKEKIL